MRLIDADKLKIQDLSTSYWSTVMGVREKDIDDAETVEAIPISWLTDQIKIASSNGEDDYANAIDWTVTKWLTEVEDGTE